jgi:16S rRNA (guanine527-N7)-methyltransferase
MPNENSPELSWQCLDLLSSGLQQFCQNDPKVARLLSPRLPEIIVQLKVYVEQIELYNPAWSLVGTNDRRELILKHILDSLAPLGIISSALAERSAPCVADVGSGAGLPGIPLAIALPEVNFTLIERKGRRAGFLRNTVDALGFHNVFVEEEEMEKVKPARFGLVTFRAFRPLDPKILKKLFRLCRGKSVLAAYKGRQEKILAEMAALEQVLPDIKNRWEFFPCPVPLLDEERHLLLFTNGARSRPCLHGHNRANEDKKGLIPRSSAAEGAGCRALPCGMIPSIGCYGTGVIIISTCPV